VSCPESLAGDKRVSEEEVEVKGEVEVVEVEEVWLERGGRGGNEKVSLDD